MKRELYFFSREIFKIAMIAYLALTAAEIIRPGTVSNFFNLNHLLAIVVLFGVSMAVSAQYKEKNTP